MSGSIEGKLVWVKGQDGNFPENAVLLDHQAYVIRAKHEGYWTPGKGVPGHKQVYIPFNGKEVMKYEYEVLVVEKGKTEESKGGERDYTDYYEWLESRGGKPPAGAVESGLDVDGEKLYVAKGAVQGETCGGKLKPSHGGAYVPWGGKEHHLGTCFVLCAK